MKELTYSVLGNNVWSLIETEDRRIASGNYDGNIFVCSFDVEHNIWTKDINKIGAHNSSVTSLCSLNDNRLISGSRDHKIKIWKIYKNNMNLIQLLNEHYMLYGK